MPTLKLTKSVIDDLRAGATDQVYWDQTLLGFGLKPAPRPSESLSNVLQHAATGEHSVNSTTPSITRRPGPSRHSASHEDGWLPRALPQHPQAPTERLDHPPFALAEKTLSPGLHRKQAAGHIEVSLSWLAAGSL